MAKILLVEDDNNLREIYEARLQAEGYTIISAKDGEEALVKAKQEKPELIISDVMMPRISGFEMLDILRNTEGLKDAKVIMLTALGQAEDKTRADALGADRYLVKSQVTLEDIVKAADELLGGTSEAATEAPSAAPTTPSTPATVVSMPVAQPPTAAPAAAQDVVPASSAVQPASNVVPIAAPAVPVAPIPVATPPSEAPVAPVISMPASPVAPPTATPSTVPAPTPVTTPSTSVASAVPNTVPSVPTDATPTAMPLPATPAPATPEAPIPVPRPAAEVLPALAPTASAEAPHAAPADITPATTGPAAKPAETPTTALPKTPESTVAVDDKLIADAVKNLSETLDTETVKPAEEAASNPPAPAEVPQAVLADEEAPKPEEMPSSAKVPTAPEVSPEVAPTPTPEAAQPPETKPADTPTDSVEPDLDLSKPSQAFAPTAPIVESSPPGAAEAVADTPEVPTQAPETPDTPPAPSPEVMQVTENAPSSADEQALMQAQIEDFISKQGKTPPVPDTKDSISTLAPAPEQTTADDTPSQIVEPVAVEPAPEPIEQTPIEQANSPSTISPTVAPAPEQTPVPERNDSVQDDVSIAHKKTIQPPVEPIQTRPDLSELLAREGIGDFDETHPTAPGSSNPHQPGHVISPNNIAPTQNTLNADDPNNIAL